ncbi:MAG: hypothetical protein N2378_18535 [Chloroflexaceae bacterium]|nr:hypothetical protein [Chloroflexaceae bacterium]
MGLALMISMLRAALLATWLVLKPVLGWFFIVIGLIGMPMPIVNGLIFLLIGLALVGPRNRLIRWSRVHLKLFLKGWAAHPFPLVGGAGRLAQRSAQQISRQHRRLRWWWLERKTRSKRPVAEQPRDMARSM